MSKKQINKKGEGEGGGGGHCSRVIAKRQLRDHFIFKWAFCTKGLGWVSRQTTFKQGKVITMVIKTIWTTKGTIIEQVGFVDCRWFISIRNACIVNFIIFFPTQNIKKLLKIPYRYIILLIASVYM